MVCGVQASNLKPSGKLSIENCQNPDKGIIKNKGQVRESKKRGR